MLRASGRPARGWWSTTPTATTSAPGVAELLAADGYEVTVVTTFAVLSPVSDQTLEGDMLRGSPAPGRGCGRSRDHDHRDQAGRRVRRRVTAAGVGGGGPRPPRRAVVGRVRRGGAGHPAGLRRRARTGSWPVTRRPWRPPGSPRCTGSATRSRPGCCRRRSSTGTGWPARSTRPDPATPLPYRPRAHRTRLGVSCPRRGGRPAEPTVTSGRGCSRWAVSLKPRTIHRGPRSPPGGRWIRCPR